MSWASQLFTPFLWWRFLLLRRTASMLAGIIENYTIIDRIVCGPTGCWSSLPQTCKCNAVDLRHGQTNDSYTFETKCRLRAKWLPHPGSHFRQAQPFVYLLKETWLRPRLRQRLVTTPEMTDMTRITHKSNRILSTIMLSQLC